MILQAAENPMTKVQYPFPTRMIRLQAPQQRQGALGRVRGMNGAIDAYTGVEDPMNPTEVTYQFRLFPKEARRTLDNMKRDLYVAVAHGQPQTLYFRDDDFNVWLAQNAKSVGYPVDVNVSSPLWQDVQVSWRLNNPFLRLSHQVGEVVWGGSNDNGTPILWGQTSPTTLIWGTTPNVFNVNSNSFDILVHNPLGVIATADVAIDISVPSGKAYGPTAPGNALAPGPNPPGIRFLNKDAVYFGAQNEVRILDTLSAGQSYSLNFPQKIAYKAGVGGAWRNLWRPVNQRQWFVFVPGDNHINVSVVGTAVASPGLTVTFRWYPRTIL